MGTDDRNITAEVEAVLDEFVRPYLASHSGNLEVAGVEGGVVFFHLTGRCAGCAAADKTSEELINRELVERVPGINAGNKKSRFGKRHQPGIARADNGAPARPSQFLKSPAL